MKRLNQQEVLEIINNDENDAMGLLYDADKRLAVRFDKIDKELVKLLKDVRSHFPDATYYTASGGFNLMLGDSHDRSSGRAQRELIACYGMAAIGDGDF